MAINEKISDMLLEGFDVPEFYKKDKPQARLILEKLTSNDWSRTKKMKREAFSQLRTLVECDERLAHKVIRGIYEAIQKHGKDALSMSDGDEKEMLNENQ